MTLIEMLVSLVILSACMALVSSVAFQVAKVLSSVQSNDQGRLAEFMLRHQVLDAAFQRAVIGRQSTAGNFFGTSSRVEFLTSAHPLFAEHEESLLVLSLEPDGGGFKKQLVLQSDGVTQIVATGSSSLRFVYLNESMKAFAQWPPLGLTDAAKLPHVVRVQDAQGQVLTQWVLAGPKFSHPAIGIDITSFGGAAR